MALIELNLEKPALKRTETAESSAKRPGSSGVKLGSTGSEKSKTGEKSTEKTGEGATMVEVPEGEPAEEESSGGGMFRRIAMLGATAGAVFAVRRWRSRRKQQSSGTAEFEEEWETPHSE